MKININYVLDDICKDWACKINRQISQLTLNQINFLKGGCWPHITLLMGEINEADLPKINEIISTMNFKALNTKIDFCKLYCKGPYIFVDVKDYSAFKEDCDNLLKSLGNLIVPHKYLISNGNPPHITLGFVQEQEKIENYLKTINHVPSTILKKVTVSQTGPHGTVICEQKLNQYKKEL